MAFGGITGKATTNWTNDEILSEATAQSLGLSAGATPDEAFGALLNKSVQYSRNNIAKNIITIPFVPDVLIFQSLETSAASGSLYNVVASPQKQYDIYIGGASITLSWDGNQTINGNRVNLYPNKAEYIALKFS